MHFTRNQHWGGVSLGIVVSLLMTGCFGGHPASRGVPLSDAMATAAGNRGNLNGGPARLEAGHSHESGWSLSLNEEADIRSEAASDLFQDFMLSLATEAVLPISNDIRNITRYELTPVAFEDDENYGGCYIGGGPVRFRSGSFPDQAVTDSWLLDVGLVGRHYLTPSKTFLSPYLTGGIFGQILFWDYRTPLNLNGEIIRSDSIYGGGGFVGLGLAVARQAHLGIFAEARLGLSAYDQATTKGFYNNVLEDYGFFSIRAGVNFKF